MQDFASKLLGSWIPGFQAASIGDSNEDAYQSVINLPRLRIDPSAIEFLPYRSLGKGGKASVFRAQLKRGFGRSKEEVAVKKLDFRRDIDKQKLTKEFINEVRIMAGSSHKNVNRLIGFVEDLNDEKAWIVLSLEPNGNVSEFLAAGKWEIAERISLIKDTFTGINYLHTQQPPICHGDLKSLNILVSSSCRAIITDFGSARSMRELGDDHQRDLMNGDFTLTKTRDADPENQLTLTGPAWALRWAAPEVVNGQFQDLASDVWAAAWVCWEIMTDKLPFHTARSATAVALKVVQGSLPDLHEEPELSLLIRLCNLMTDCWAYYPKERPNLRQCYKEVKWMPSIPPSKGTSVGNRIPSVKLSHQMGLIHYAGASHETALSMFQQAQSIAHSMGDEKSIVKALQRLGDVYRAQSRYGEAEEVYVQARDSCNSIDDRRGQANAVLGLAHVYRLQFKYDKAEEFFMQAQKLYIGIDNTQGRANALRGLGHVYRAQSKHAEAIRAYADAQELYIHADEDQGRANTLLGMGNIYRLQSKYADAEESFTRAQAIYARIGDLGGQANTLRGMGQTFYAQSKYAEAEGFYIQAQDIYTRISGGRGQANVLLGLGHVYLLQSKYEEAEGSFTRAKELWAHYGSHIGQANALRGLGYIRRHQGLRFDAELFFANAKEIDAQTVNAESEGDA